MRNNTLTFSDLYNFLFVLAVSIGFTTSPKETHAQITYSGETKFWIHSDSPDPMDLRPDTWTSGTLYPTAKWSMTFADVPFVGDPDPSTFMYGSITVYDKVLDIVGMANIQRPIIIGDNVGQPRFGLPNGIDLVKFVFNYKRPGYDTTALGELRYDINGSSFTLGSPKTLPTFSWKRFVNYQYGPRSYGYQFRNNGGIQAVETPNQNPIAVAGSDQEIQCAGELTQVELNAFGSSDPDGDALVYEWSIPGDSNALLIDPTNGATTGFFPGGPTLVTLTVDDGKGGIAVDDVLIMVVDSTPPVLICTTDKIALWPPNHKMQDVTICIAASDACDDPENLKINCTISSNEPDDAKGDGYSAGDVNDLDGFTAPVTVELVYDPISGNFYGIASLRAERNGAESGRNYSIVASVTDSANNVSTASCVVVVPRDKRKK